MRDEGVIDQVRQKYAALREVLDERVRRQWAATLADELSKTGHPVSDRTVARLLKEADYRLQANRKTQEGRSHPERNAQFEPIHAQMLDFQKRHQPVVSVDTKKKEWVGNFKTPSREWQPSGQPVAVKLHDFPDPKLGKAIP